MSEYIETEVLNAIKTMGVFRTSYPKDVVEKVVNNALKIADHLEHCYFTDHQVDYYNYDGSEYSAGYKNGYIDGYKQALADIRGDTE